MSKKTTYIHAENNNKILSSNEVRLYVPPDPEKIKIIIWGKELCNGAEWNDFLKCVEEKTHEYENEIKELENSQTQIAISELEKVNGILTDTIIEVTHNEFDLNKLCYLEEISARFYEKMQEQIKELKGE